MQPPFILAFPMLRSYMYYENIYLEFIIIIVIIKLEINQLIFIFTLTVSKLFQPKCKKYFTNSKKYVTLNFRGGGQLMNARKKVICNRLAVLRAEKKWSQKLVAEKVGVSRQTIISLEANRYNPSLKLAFDLADIFEKDINDVFQYVEEE